MDPRPGRGPRTPAAAGTMRAWLDEEVSFTKDACLEAYRLGRERVGDRLLLRLQALCRARYRLLKGCDR